MIRRSKFLVCLAGAWRQRVCHIPAWALAALFLPLFLVGSCHSNNVSSLSAYAATAKKGRPAVLAKMSGARGLEYSHLLADLLFHKPDALMDLVGEDIRLILDEPGLTREEGGNVVWQYRSASCVLDIFFEKRGAEGYAPVAYYEFRKRQKALAFTSTDTGNVEADSHACLQSLVNRNKPGVNGSGDVVLADART